MRLALVFAVLATPAVAGVEEALENHVLPGFDTFAAETADLASAARADCTAASLRPAYHAAVDAWMAISHLRFGPLEEGGRALAIAFWPDTRGMVGRTVARLVAEEDAAVESREAFAEVSVAGRGLMALERLLYEEDLAVYGPEDYGCALALAMTTDLARMGADLQADWQVHAALMRNAGVPGNTAYLSPQETQRALYTALVTGLDFIAQQRLARPLGTFERPRPRRAEARRSGRSLRNVILSLSALDELARALADQPIPQTEAAFDAALDTARELEDPIFAGVAEPAGRLKVEILQQAVDRTRQTVAAQLGAQLGLSEGFNAQDGD
jgi:hypothetical protein